MAEPGARKRTRITVPRVEFDLGGLFVGMIGIFAYELLWRLLAPAFGLVDKAVKVAGQGGWVDGQLHGHAALRGTFWAQVFDVVRLPYLDGVLLRLGAGLPNMAVPGAEEGQLVAYRPDALAWWQVGVTVVALLVLWSIIGGALARIHAVRIARDESISWDDGLAYSFGNLKAFIAAPLFTIAAATLFAGLTALAGALTAVPWAGPILQVVVQPLAMLSGLVVTILMLGAIFGLPLLHGALAAERNGTLDAVSRTYSYAFTRPVLYAAGGALVFVVAGIIESIGAWVLERGSLTLMTLGASWADGAPEALITGFGTARAFGMPGDLSAFDTSQTISVWVSFVWSAIGLLALRGFVLSYVVGGLTDLYMLLREDVDGTPRTEVYIEGEGEVTLGDPLPGEPRDRPVDPAGEQAAPPPIAE